MNIWVWVQAVTAVLAEACSLVGEELLAIASVPANSVRMATADQLLLIVRGLHSQLQAQVFPAARKNHLVKVILVGIAAHFAKVKLHQQKIRLDKRPLSEQI